MISDRRVLMKVGFIRRRTVEMFIPKMESVSVEQGIMGRVLNYGDITLRGTGGTVEPFDCIAAPLEFRSYIQRAQSASFM